MSSQRRKTNVKNVTNSAKLSNPNSRAVTIADKDNQRANAEKKRKKYQKELGTAQRSRERFEAQDIPEFQKWFSEEFDPLRDRYQKLETKLAELLQLTDEVEDAHFMEGLPYREAYKHAIRKREHPEEFADDFEDDDEADDEKTRRFFDSVFGAGNESEQASGDPFEQDLRDIFYDMTGAEIDPEDPMFKEIFERFKKEFGFTQAPPEVESARKAPASRDLKKLYRSLARKLHPDHQEKLDPKLKKKLDTLWHETQEAYAHGELERLQRIDSIIDIEINGIDERTDTDRILDAAEQHRIELRSVQREIRQARKHPAWMFSKKPQIKDELRIEIDDDFSGQIFLIEQEIEYLEKRIKTWSAPPKKKKKAKQKTGASAKKKAKQKPAPVKAKPIAEETSQQFEMPF